MNYTEQQINLTCELKELDIPHRTISQAVFGKPTAASSVWKILTEHYYNPVKRKPRVLMFDIESSPIKCYSWGLFNQNINIGQIIEDWYLLSWSAKFLGSKQVAAQSLKHHGVCDGKSFKGAERGLLDGIWKLLDRADVVVAHNGVRFDKRKLNAKFLEHGMQEPSPYKVVDTLRVFKHNFAMTSNKLDYIARFLSVDGKMEHEGFALWAKCLAGDPDAFDKMLAYNIQDIHVLEEVYMTVRGWDKGHPNMALYTAGNEAVCNKCGGVHLTEMFGKHAYTNVSQYTLYRCNTCQGFVRGKQNLVEKEKKDILLMNYGG